MLEEKVFCLSSFHNWIKILHKDHDELQLYFKITLVFIAAINAGQGFLAGASVLGLGALGYYGLGLSKEAGAIDKAM